MGWFSSLFTSLDSSQRVRKGQALSSTHDAFSLPTSSPGFGSHPDAFSPAALQTPDIDAQTPSYTYPPAQTNGQYGYIPSPLTASSRQGSASLLPTHMNSTHSPLSPSHHQYPPLERTWNRLRVWLNREYPELGDTLNYGILPQDLAEVELNLGIQLPSAVRESYLCVDGQEPESAAGCSEGLFFGLTLLPLENVLQEWRFWREVDEDSTTGANPRLLELMQSMPPRWIRLDYSNRGWIPLIADKAGNYVGIDMNPGEEGSVGQVILFGRDFDTKVVLWNGDGWGGWAKWLSAFADELESGEGFEVGHGDTSDDGSDDGVGYESYYHDGSGRGAGDGGGSGAVGGLRLTGEYRGWSVLEAWGDRSLRKWQEVGLLPEYTEEPARAIENVGLGVGDITYGSGVEVPIPVVLEGDHTPESSSSSSAHGKTRSTAVPTISVTKPPAPRPVDLPTQSDISPSLHDDPLGASREYDLESGLGHPRTQDLQEEIALVDSKRSSVREPLSPLLRGESESSASALPLSPPPPMDSTSAATISKIIATDNVPSSASPKPIIPDLMMESAPPIAAVPLAPSQSMISSLQVQPNGVSHVVSSESSSEDEDDESEDEKSDSDRPADEKTKEEASPRSSNDSGDDDDEEEDSSDGTPSIEPPSQDENEKIKSEKDAGTSTST